MNKNESDGTYMGGWAEGGRFAMVADFADVFLTEAEYTAETWPYANQAYWEETKEKMAAALASPTYDVRVIVADYERGNYDGDAFVLFEQDGKLYEVNAGHCSCYGLEGQWSPQETSIPALRRLMETSEWGRFKENAEFRKTLDAELARMEKSA